MPKFEILDCTIRDGGYINNWEFDTKLVREVYRALSKSGVEYVEIGFRGTEKHFDRKKYGKWRFTPEEQIREAINNIVGAKLALMADYFICPALILRFKPFGSEFDPTSDNSPEHK